MLEREWAGDVRKGSAWSRSVFIVAISVSVSARRRSRVLESYAWMSTGAGEEATEGSGSLSSDSEPGGVDGSSSWPSKTGGRPEANEGVRCGVARRDDEEASRGAL